MPGLPLVLPSKLLRSLEHAAVQRGVPLDSLAGAILSGWLKSAHHRLFQISTSAALVEGAFREGISSRVLVSQGDFGLGTFPNLDGEMAILDGIIYQIRGDGSVQTRIDDFSVPFAVITQFESEHTFETDTVASFQALKHLCDAHRESENLFYAIRVDGVFQTVHARAVRESGPGTQGGLANAAEQQAEFHFQNVEGTLVGFWSPVYSKAFNIPGYHLHFLSHDRKQGGHLMDCSARSLRIGIQMLCDYDVHLPEHGKFMTADLTRDPAQALSKAE